MPKRALFELSWSPKNHTYELFSSQGKPLIQVSCDENESWWQWLEYQTSFSFQGRQGHLNVRKEARARGEGYWYAYAYSRQQKVKHYLGTTRSVTIARLEDIASIGIHGEVSSPQAREQQDVSMYSSASRPAATISGMLLLPKLSPPRLSTNLITRARLSVRLDLARTHALTLLSATAGSGKTTLLSAWKAHTTTPVAWLTLDEQDNDPVRFWSYVIAALRTCSPTFGGYTLSLLQAPKRPAMGDVLTALINEAATLREDLILLLDDMHVIEEQEIYAELQFLLAHLPAQFHIMLSSRFDPPLALSRLRARGQMIEIRDTDLRFTREEIIEFFTQATSHCPSEEVIRVLESRTEGWIAGLHLLALALQERNNHIALLQQIEGNQRFILEYMQEEILEQQSASLQRFLLQTAILPRLQASLCQAVTGEENSQELLEDLARRHLFLVSLDERQQWYRFHSLFRDVLLSRLQSTQSEQVPLLQKRAALWYDKQGLLAEALPHALEALDYAYVADLLERFIIPQSWRNEYHTLRRWLSRLPTEVLAAHPELSFVYAYAIVLTSPRGPHLLSLIEEPLSLAEQGYLASASRERLGAVLTLRAVLTSFQGDFTRAFVLAHRAWDMLPEQENQWRGQCLSLLGTETALLGESSAALSLLQRGLALCEASGSLPGTFFALSMLGDVLLAQGKLRQAAHALHQVITRSNERQELLQHQLTLETGEREVYYERLALYGLAALAYERNDLEEAERFLDEALSQGQFVWPHVLTAGIWLQVRLLCARGLVEKAQMLLDDFMTQHFPSETMRELYCCQCWLALKIGDVALARHLSSTLLQEDMPIAFARQEEEAFLRIRLALKDGQVAVAREQIVSWKQTARKKGRRYSELRFLILEAMALETSGARTQAKEVLAQACTLARSENSQRVFLDEGEQVEALLKALLLDLSAGSLASFVRTLLHAFSAGRTPSQQPTATSSQQVSLLPEPLTPQEQRVLRLIAEGASNQVIAHTLVISLTTTKKHVANILSKLGAQNRTQAVARAREYTLL